MPSSREVGCLCMNQPLCICVDVVEVTSPMHTALSRWESCAVVLPRRLWESCRDRMREQFWSPSDPPLEVVDWIPSCLFCFHNAGMLYEMTHWSDFEPALLGSVWINKCSVKGEPSLQRYCRISMWKRPQSNPPNNSVYPPLSSLSLFLQGERGSPGERVSHIITSLSSHCRNVPRSTQA